CLNLHIPTLFEKSTSMQIVPFLTHYQLVYANFDFSSFSLISYTLKTIKLHDNMLQITTQEFCVEPPLSKRLINRMFPFIRRKSNIHYLLQSKEHNILNQI
ncbi:MAG: hypothetical protein ACFN0J_11760, partial [Segatella salivae]